VNAGAAAESKSGVSRVKEESVFAIAADYDSINRHLLVIAH